MVEAIVDFSKGASNTVPPDKLPEGYVRELINFDAGSILTVRTGYQKIMEGKKLKAIFSLGTDIILADGDQLLSYDTLDNTVKFITTIPAYGQVVGTVFNNCLYIMTQGQSLKMKDKSISQWTIDNPSFDVEIITGNLKKGRYKVSVTQFTDSDEESGANLKYIDLPANSGLKIITSALKANVYLSECDAQTLYYQGQVKDGSFYLINLNVDTKRLVTANLYPFPYVENLISHHGVLIGSIGNLLYLSVPFMPHLCSLDKGFFQFSKDISIIASVTDGIYVVADKTYFLSGVETLDVNQVVVSNTEAVRGTLVNLPDGRVAWFSIYGQVIASASGQLEMPQKGIYAPSVASNGASSYMEHNGKQLIVNSLNRGQQNGLVFGDYWDVRVTNDC